MDSNASTFDQKGTFDNTSGQYTVYAAGGLFTQHDLTTNVLIKKAVWRLSNGQFQLILPQTKELRRLEGLDVAASLRNMDILQVVKADLVLVRFDGPELDTGTVVEYMIAKTLGKPAVILRSDTRHLSGQDLDEPYNLMVKNWPRTVEVFVDALMAYVGFIAEERKILKNTDTFEKIMEAELRTIRAGIEKLAGKIIGGLEKAIKLPSPYPSEYQELIYKIIRYCPGAEFNQLLPDIELKRIFQRLQNNKTL